MLAKHKGRFLRGAPFLAQPAGQRSGFRKGTAMSEHSTTTTTASPTRTEAELRALMARAVREVRETNPLMQITNLTLS